MNEQVTEMFNFMVAMMVMSMGMGMIKPVMLQTGHIHVPTRGEYKKIDGRFIPIEYAPLKESV